MNSNKKAFSLLELIFTLFISSIILVYTFDFLKISFQTQSENEKTILLKLDMNSTKIIIEKNLPLIKNELNYKENTLYLNNNILLEHVSSFTMQSNSKTLSIDITLDNKISQRWEFEL